MNIIQIDKYSSILLICLWIISGTLTWLTKDIFFVKINATIYLIMLIIQLWFSYLSNKSYWKLSELMDMTMRLWKNSNERIIQLLEKKNKLKEVKNGNKQRSSHKSNQRKK